MSKSWPVGSKPVHVLHSGVPRVLWSARHASGPLKVPLRWGECISIADFDTALVKEEITGSVSVSSGIFIRRRVDDVEVAARL